jgi:glycine/D-amino acid oxidase-like deaminating enzyme/nitrite reductase/ring-hydroxylating ferredoxin subunit
MTANAAQEASRSLWMEIEGPNTLPLRHDAAADVLVVGAGIAGLSSAYELAQQGLSVIVVDKGSIGGGMSLRTSAHLSWELDDYYFELIKRRGEDAACAYFESQKAAVARIEAIVRAEEIGCDFARVDAFLVASGDAGEEAIEDELEAARRAGFAEAGLAQVPERFGKVAVRFPNQARFHPAKYLYGLAAALERKGVALYAHSHVKTFEEENGEVAATLVDGVTIKARIGVVTTNSPINDKLAIHTKQAPYRTYVIAARAPKGALPDALIWDTEEPYHYVRLQPGEDDDVVLIGGEDHKSGEESDGDARIARLRAWAEARIPGLGETTHAWSGQVYEPIDYIPHMGRNPGDKNVYVITGDSGEGLTSGVAGARLIADLVAQGSSPFEDLYDPERKKLRAAGAFVKENLDVAANFTEHLTSGEIDDVDALQPGSGALVRAHGKKLAVYRDDAGKLHVCSATCPHMGCIVQFNSFEQCWDCPCHGSQFNVDGEVLAGPSRAPLERAEL